MKAYDLDIAANLTYREVNLFCLDRYHLFNLHYIQLSISGSINYDKFSTMIIKMYLKIIYQIVVKMNTNIWNIT